MNGNEGLLVKQDRETQGVQTNIFHNNSRSPSINYDIDSKHRIILKELNGAEMPKQYSLIRKMREINYLNYKCSKKVLRNQVLKLEENLYIERRILIQANNK